MEIEEVKARDLRPGDVLFVQVDRPTVNPVAVGRSWRVQSAAVQKVMEHLSREKCLGKFWDYQFGINDTCSIVETNSPGFFCVKLRMKSGAVVKVGKNVFLAIYKKED